MVVTTQIIFFMTNEGFALSIEKEPFKDLRYLKLRILSQMVLAL